MISATARVIQNVIEVKVGAESWTCRPVVSATGAITRKIAALFSTTYETFRSTEPTVVHSTVSYSAKKDEILIQVGEKRWKTKSSIFGPMSFEYGGLTYSLHEKITGRFGITDGTKVVASGELGFRSCVVRESPPEIEEFLAMFAVGYLIRSLFWQMLR